MGVFTPKGKHRKAALGMNCDRCRMPAKLINSRPNGQYLESQYRCPDHHITHRREKIA